MISLINGNTFRIPLRDKSVHMVCFSPPYYGLRLYDGIEPLVFGGDAECQHAWGDEMVTSQRGENIESSTLGGGLMAGGVARVTKLNQGAFCAKCGAWRGHFGNEPLHDCGAWARGDPPCGRCYVCHSRMYAAECWRVLRDDGTMWVNLGDSYAGSNQGVMADGTQVAGKKQTTNAGSVNGLTGMRGKDLPGLKPKDIIGIPWAVAFALRSDGWYLRQDIVWAKSCSGAYTGGSCMPESVTDRMTKSHEYVFLLSKSQEYYFDHIAIREAAHYDGRAATMMRGSKKYANGFVPNQPEQTCHARGHERWNWEDGQAYRNRRSVWTVNPKPYSGAHYATWPPDLVEPMIRAGTSEHGCCPDCGAPWERVADHVPATSKKCPKTDAIYQAQGGNGEKKTGTIGMSGGGRIDGSVTTIGWQPTCDCDAGDPIPCTVLDPFAGSGTTLVVARQLGRSAIGLDLSLKYMRDNARTRLEFDQLGAWESGAVGGNGDCDLADLPLFSNGAG